MMVYVSPVINLVISCGKGRHADISQSTYSRLTPYSWHNTRTTRLGTSNNASDAKNLSRPQVSDNCIALHVAFDSNGSRQQNV